MIYRYRVYEITFNSILLRDIKRIRRKKRTQWCYALCVYYYYYDRFIYLYINIFLPSLYSCCCCCCSSLSLLIDVKPFVYSTNILDIGSVYICMYYILYVFFSSALRSVLSLNGISPQNIQHNEWWWYIWEPPNKILTANQENGRINKKKLKKIVNNFLLWIHYIWEREKSRKNFWSALSVIRSRLLLLYYSNIY